MTKSFHPWCRSPLRAVIWAAHVHRSPKREVDGVQIVDTTAGEHDGTPVMRLAAAIELIGRINPRIQGQIRRYLNYVAVIFHGGPGYVPFANACVFDVAHLTQQLPIRIAAELVHETVHARLERAGIRFANATAERIERACVRAEIDFLRPMPEASELREGYERLLRSPDMWWNGDAQLERQLSGLAGEGAPQWIVKLLRRHFRRSSRQR